MIDVVLSEFVKEFSSFGTVYGIALHATERPQTLVAGDSAGAPKSPVLFIKPRNTFLSNGGAMRVPDTMPAVEASATLAMIFGRDTRRVQACDALANVAAYTLAIDITESGTGYFRPPIREKCRDGFLPLSSALISTGKIAALHNLRVSLLVDGTEVASTLVGQTLDLISRSIEHITTFMTFREADVLLVARTDSVQAPVGSRIGVLADGFEPLECKLQFETESGE